MKLAKRPGCICAVLSLTLLSLSVWAQQNTAPFYSLLKRVAPAHAGKFIAEIILSKNNYDCFELDYRNNKIILRGNNNNSLAVGLNYYLKYYCYSSVSWYAADPVKLPAVLPPVLKPVRQEAKTTKRFFLNYCTFGYTMPWWQWKDWERLIDWMALSGINMPLAITGQEAVWYKVWQQLGLSDKEIRGYFSGPAHLPWHRMSNIDRWQGPLPLSYIDHQLELQKKILKRERELDMMPVLPAFAGHVPEALKQKFPNAKILKLSDWGGFTDAYRTYFLDPFDTLFIKIQKSFLTEQAKVFGTDHIYGADPFNEVKPPDWEPEYLARVSKTIYESMSSVDSDATWLMMAWIFYFERDLWTNERIKSFVEAVPANKLVLLDYYCEKAEVWKMTESFFGHPYLWCYLGNFGGNTMLAGNIRDMDQKIQEALQKGGDNLSGVGSTLEALDVNPLMYEYVFEKIWRSDTMSYHLWIEKWADRRFGKSNTAVHSIWRQLADSVYAYPARLGQATLTNSRPSLQGNGNWTTDPHIDYSNKLLFKLWQTMVSNCNGAGNSYRYDIVNTGRQVLGNHFTVLRDSFAYYYDNRHFTELKTSGRRLLELLDDMDRLLASHHNFLLGKWLNDAKAFGKTGGEKKYYEENARVILTTWGVAGQSLNDYANRSWAGLVKTYYKERWTMFIGEAIKAAESGRPLDEHLLHANLTAFEARWTKLNQNFSSKPAGDAVAIAKELVSKYRNSIMGDTKKINHDQNTQGL